jgi:flagellar motor switch protein FliG
MSEDYYKMTKVRRLAAFLILIGHEAAAEILRQFDNAQLESVCREMASIPYVDPSLKNLLIGEFGSIVRDGLDSALGGIEVTQLSLELAKGGTAASSIMSRVAPGGGGQSDDEFADLDASQVFNLLKDEQGQTIAFVLTFLPALKGAEFVKQMAVDKREEVIECLGKIEPTSRESVKKVSANLQKFLDKRVGGAQQKTDGIAACAAIVNALDRDTKKTLLKGLEGRDAALGAKIRSKTFPFEDLARIDAQDLAKVVKEINQKDGTLLALALKSSPPEVVDPIAGTLSKRAAAALKEEIEMMPPQRPKEVQKAQESILEIVRKLEDAGDISTEIAQTSAPK